MEPMQAGATQSSTALPQDEEQSCASLGKVAQELLSAVASLSGGCVRDRDSLPTEDEPASPEPKRQKCATNANASLVAEEASSGASSEAPSGATDDVGPPNSLQTLQELRHLVSKDEMYQTTQPNARVEKWFFNRWYVGTVLRVPREGRVTVHFDDLPPPGRVDVDAENLRLIRRADQEEDSRTSAAHSPVELVSSPGLDLKAWSEQQRLNGAPIIGQTHGFVRVAAAESAPGPAQEAAQSAFDQN